MGNPMITGGLGWSGLPGGSGCLGRGFGEVFAAWDGAGGGRRDGRIGIWRNEANFGCMWLCGLGLRGGLNGFPGRLAGGSSCPTKLDEELEVAAVIALG